MKAEELPGTPKIWLEFLTSRNPLLPVPSGIDALAGHAKAVRTHASGNEDFIRTAAAGAPACPLISENIQRLSRGGSVAVIAGLHPGLFGGPFSQVLKCLTVTKLCEELANRSVPAIPVGWINPDPPRDFSQWSITLLDGDAEIRIIETAPFGLITEDRMASLISSISEMGHGLFDPETLECLRDAFAPGESLDSSFARLFSALMKEWGMVILNPSAPECRPIITEAIGSLRVRIPDLQSLIRTQTSRLAAEGYADPFPDGGIPLPLIQGSLLPVVAHVADPADVYCLAKASGAFDQANMTKPSVWPRLSATVGDSKIRKIFARHNLDLHRLYSGEGEVLRTIRNSLPKEIPAKLEAARSEVERQMARLKSLLSNERGFSEEAESCKGKIVYQLDKLRKHAVTALESREQTASRHIRRACNSLAPQGRPQESELAGIQIPLNYSLAGIRGLREKLNLTDLQHQLIWMD